MSGGDHGERIAEARAWLPFVDADLTTVRLTLEADPPVLAIAAYHCQQAAEKLLKSLMVLGGLPLRKTHDLDTLVAQVGSVFPEARDLMGESLGITSWGFAYRYPRAGPAFAEPPAAGDITVAVEAIERLRAFVLRAVETA